MLVYDLTRQSSFESIDKWLKQIKNYGDESMAAMLIGNKSDLKHLRSVRSNIVISGNSLRLRQNPQYALYLNFGTRQYQRGAGFQYAYRTNGVKKSKSAFSYVESSFKHTGKLIKNVVKKKVIKIKENLLLIESPLVTPIPSFLHFSYRHQPALVLHFSKRPLLIAYRLGNDIYQFLISRLKQSLQISGLFLYELEFAVIWHICY